MFTIISGTNRPNNNSLKLASQYAHWLEEAGQEVQVLDLEKLPQDFIYTASYGKHHQGFADVIEKFIVPAEKIIFIAPEYNGSIPGVLKSFIDCINPDVFYGKKSALVGLSAGRAGNLRGMEDLTGILHYLKVEVLSSKPKLSVYQSISEEGSLMDEASIKQIKEQIQKIISF